MLIRHSLSFLLAIGFAVTSLPAAAQVAISTVAVGNSPAAAAVNPTTNTIYAVNKCGNDPACNSNGTLSVINGATLATQTVSVGVQPRSVAVDSATNKIYVANKCGDDPSCSTSRNGTVTVIDGATLSTHTVTVGVFPYSVAVNPVTNQIYVSDEGDGTVTVIDGVTLSTQTITLTPEPHGVAVNSVTNQIYVATGCDSERCHVGVLTIIDGLTLSTQIVELDVQPTAIAVDSMTNQIYVINSCGNELSCTGNGNLSVVDGTTLATHLVNLDRSPYDLDINPVTNKIYVTNTCGTDTNCSTYGTVTVIDGATLSTQDITVGSSPFGVKVNSVSNKIYVANACGNDPTCNSAGTVTVIDGATNALTPVAVGDGPSGEAIDSTTNRVYALNATDGTVSIIAGDTGLQFAAVTPCRLVDTRVNGGPIPGGTYRAFNLPQLARLKGCASLAKASAYSLNVTVVPSGTLGYLTVWPSSERQPLVSTLNSVDGRVKANAAIVQGGTLGAVNVYVTHTANVVIDIDGYFTLPGASTLAFYPLTPCRVADTRRSDFPPFLGTPHLAAKVERDFPVRSSDCQIPDTALAYSLNFTAVPYPAMGYPLGYLEVWPTGEMPQNPVSTLNNQTGTIVANAAIVPAGTDGQGEIAVYPSNDTDLVIDVNGYFAPPGAGGLSLYPSVPCRVLDTRKVGNGQPFSGLLNPPVDVVGSICGPASTAQAYVFNATVVPSGELGYLTLWQNDPAHQPVVSTLNAPDGEITNNMAIVPTTDGKIDAYAGNGITQLILDISSYFAP